MAWIDLSAREIFGSKSDWDLLGVRFERGTFFSCLLWDEKLLQLKKINIFISFCLHRRARKTKRKLIKTFSFIREIKTCWLATSPFWILWIEYFRSQRGSRLVNIQVGVLRNKKIVKKFWWKSFGAKNELKSFLIYYAIWSEIGFQCYVYFVSVTTVNLDLFSINESYLILLPSFPIFVRIDRSRFPFTLFFGSLNRLTWISKVATDINLFSLLETSRLGRS